MIYVYDNNSLSNILNHYYPDRFPSFWEKFDEMIQNGEIISVREVRFELTSKFSDEVIDRLVKYNDAFFANPTPEELGFITKIYSVLHFQQNLDYVKEQAEKKAKEAKEARTHEKVDDGVFVSGEERETVTGGEGYSVDVSSGGDVVNTEEAVNIVDDATKSALDAVDPWLARRTNP